MCLSIIEPLILALVHLKATVASFALPNTPLRDESHTLQSRNAHDYARACCINVALGFSKNGLPVAPTCPFLASPKMGLLSASCETLSGLADTIKAFILC